MWTDISHTSGSAGLHGLTECELYHNSSSQNRSQPFPFSC